MSHEVPILTKEFRTHLCSLFEDASLVSNEPVDLEEALYRCGEYEALCWLRSKDHMTASVMVQMVEDMAKESIESLFWLEEVSYRFSDRLGNPLTLCQLDLGTLILHCQERFKVWQSLAPHVWSPFQRPCYFEQSKQNGIEAKLQQKFSTILKGFSFRHLSVLHHQNELKIAKNLLPYIYEEVVVLKDPQAPFDKLPRLPEELPKA